MDGMPTVEVISLTREGQTASVEFENYRGLDEEAGTANRKLVLAVLDRMEPEVLRTEISR